MLFTLFYTVRLSNGDIFRNAVNFSKKALINRFRLTHLTEFRYEITKLVEGILEPSVFIARLKSDLNNG